MCISNEIHSFSLLHIIIIYGHENEREKSNCLAWICAAVIDLLTDSDRWMECARANLITAYYFWPQKIEQMRI